MPSFTLVVAEILTDLFDKLGRDYLPPNPEEPMTPPTTPISVPKLRRQLVIDSVTPEDRYIVFYTDQDTTQLFNRFGTMSKSGQSHYFLDVDPRYDFQEVLAYVRSFEGQLLPTKTVLLENGSTLVWEDWGGLGQEDFPTIGRAVWDQSTQTQSIIVGIDPTHYNHTPGSLRSQEVVSGLVHRTEDYGFDTVEQLIQYLNELKSPQDVAIYGFTVWATDRAVQAAYRHYQADQEENACS